MLYHNKIKVLLNEAILKGNSSISINAEKISTHELEELKESSMVIRQVDNLFTISY